MKRVLLLSNIFPSRDNPIGGTFIRSRIRALEAHGVAVDAVAVGPRRKDPMGTEAFDFFDATVATHPAQRLLLRLGRGARPLEGKSLRRVADLVNANDYSGIMAHGLYSLGAGHVASRLAEQMDLPFTLHLHGSDVNVSMPRNPKASVRTMQAANAAIFVSAALRDKAMSMGYDGSNALVTGNGVDVDVFRSDLKQQAVPSQPTVLFVGNLLPVKGADRLPQIFREILRLRPGARFVVVGDGPLRDPLERELRTLPADLLGRVPPPRVAELMGQASVTILPSRNEGWPTVINESYAVGTPVVAANVGGVSEALADRRWAVPDGPDFAERFAQCVAASLADEPEGLREHARKYEWSSIAAQELEALARGRDRETN